MLSFLNKLLCAIIDNVLRELIMTLLKKDKGQQLICIMMTV